MAGIEPATLADPVREGAPYALSAAARYALDRLGPDQFLEWVYRGYQSKNV